MSKLRKAARDPAVHAFAERARRMTDQQLYDACHPQIPITQELIDTVAQDVLDDVMSVLQAQLPANLVGGRRTDDRILSTIGTILHDWYSAQPTANNAAPPSTEPKSIKFNPDAPAWKKPGRR